MLAGFLNLQKCLLKASFSCFETHLDVCFSKYVMIKNGESCKRVSQ